MQAPACTNDRQPDQVIRVGERVQVRKKVRRVENLTDPLPNRVRIPAERPCDQHRIAEVVWQVRGEVTDQRIGEGDGDRSQAADEQRDFGRDRDGPAHRTASVAQPW
jgi:hypothetical protein